MALITIEIDDSVLQNFFNQLATAAAGTDLEPAKEEKPKRTRKTKDKPAEEKSSVNAEAIKEAANKLLGLTDKETVKDIIADFGCKSVAAASKLKGEEIVECHEALLEAIAEEEEADDGKDDESEITVEAVKKAVQAFSKKNGKEDTDEILEDFGIKSVRSLDKLEQEDLEELYAEVMA